MRSVELLFLVSGVLFVTCGAFATNEGNISSVNSTCLYQILTPFKFCLVAEKLRNRRETCLVNIVLFLIFFFTYYYDAKI